MGPLSRATYVYDDAQRVMKKLQTLKRNRIEYLVHDETGALIEEADLRRITMPNEGR